MLNSTALPNGVSADYEYDAAGRLDAIVYSDSDDSLVSSFHYEFDANGNRTSVEVRRPNTATPAADNLEISKDEANANMIERDRAYEQQAVETLAT